MNDLSTIEKPVSQRWRRFVKFPDSLEIKRGFEKVLCVQLSICEEGMHIAHLADAKKERE